MRFTKIAVALGLTVSFCMAQLNISGTVTDSLSGAGLLGAKVTLKNTGLSATTDFAGAFSITRSSGATEIISGSSKAIAPSVPVMSAQGEIWLSLQDAAQVTVKTYSVEGKQLGSMERTYSAGSHSIMPAKANSGVCLYQVVVNGKAYTLQRTNVAGGTFGRQQAANGSTIASQGLAKSAANLAFADSLVVSKAWYASQQIAVTDSVASGLTFKMRANDQDCPFASNGAGHTTVNAGIYIIDQDQWNTDYDGQYTSTLYMCSPLDFYWVIKMNDNDHTGACKEYPNIHKDYNPSGTPPGTVISTFSSLTVDFDESNPHGANMDYETAFDIWVNGVANPAGGSTEFMIWNDNWYQLPGGTKQNYTVTLQGRVYTPWLGYSSGHYSYIVYYPAVSYSSVRGLDMLAFFNYAISMGWLPANSTLLQLDFGYEMVSTNNIPSTFSISNFAIHDPVN